MKKYTILFALAVGLINVGCASSQHQTNPIPAYDPNKTNASTAANVSSKRTETDKALRDFLKGLEDVELALKADDYKKASATLLPLRGPFHGVLHPTAMEQKGEDYANQIHQQFMDLEDALAKHDDAKSQKMIENNRTNAFELAKSIGIILN